MSQHLLNAAEPSGRGRFHPVWLIIYLSLFCSTAAFSQVELDGVSARDLIKAEEEAEQILEEKQQTAQPTGSGQDTPLESMLSLRAATRAKDWEAAGKILDRRYLPDEMEQYSAEELLKNLGYVFNQQNIIHLGKLSDHPQGHLDDGLPSYRDLIGQVELSKEEVPIYLQRVPDGKGGRVWKISNATVAKIPLMWEELGPSPAAIYLNKLLPDFKFMGMDNWQLVLTVVFFLLSWPLATVVTFVLLQIALKIPNGFPQGIERFFRRPLRFFLFMHIARELISAMGLSVTARILLESSGMDYIAYTVLLMGLLSLIRDYQIRKMQVAGNAQYVALLKPFTTIIKFTVLTIILLFWANQAGYDMSTILAGLGVGSLAVALAAQKTLENVIGAVTLYTARPVSAGDFCRFGNFFGTVEEIGLRSTLIRTLNRTLVVIPNSVFSSMEIENFSSRDRIRYFRNLRMRLLSSEQTRFVLAEIRKLMLGHPRLLQETVSVRFEYIQDGNAMLRIDAGVNTTDFQQYLAVAEDLNLRIVDIVQDAGASFTGPGQLVQLQESEPTTAEQQAYYEKMLNELREQERLPFPDYSDAERRALKDTVEYPPKGSPG
jgi:MscS family membrane protein